MTECEYIKACNLRVNKSEFENVCLTNATCPVRDLYIHPKCYPKDWKRAFDIKNGVKDEC